MRTIIEGEEIQIEKVWREVKENIEKRYSRCLTFDFNSKTYLLDSVDKTLKEVNKEEIAKEYILNPEENEYPYFGG